jgi:two-component system, NtrC family, nitrogen regulation sensor histidine kinase NtrY
VVINGQLDRLERIVQDFLQFARPSEPELVPLDAASIVRDMVELLEQPLRRRGIELKLELAEGVRFRGDRQQLQQVLLNLIQNGADSISDAGTIHLRVKAGMAKLDRELAPVALFEVADTGKGIPSEAEQRIFDPFFSTKEGGTGLGLPIAARIAEKHGGVLQYHSQRNAGTTFTLVLPRITDEGGNSAH